jgi:3-mercaptopyruvate sulfurtransferase SseA
MNILRHRPVARPVLTWLAAAALLVASVARAEVVSAGVAQQRLQEGAQAVDVRPAGSNKALLPGTLQLEAAVWEQWLQTGNVRALSRAVSAAGLDLSRDVLIYGEAGDARAQALYEALRPLATGQLLWLVGGIDEWRLSGRRTASAAIPHLPVPQYLVAQGGDPAAAPRMAAASLRDPVHTPTTLAAR